MGERWVGGVDRVGEWESERGEERRGIRRERERERERDNRPGDRMGWDGMGEMDGWMDWSAASRGRALGD